ncbi:hypothetical protein DPMN_070064 [Dreissena polymorpha]|uniref:Uncharacterized protein n=1 Tax=Dreissena polymorpha TaxID=45954 RepID=A0A9D3Z5B7_DREPO|nr:hypothetical protein DPMN_070064 [Dreissena polymorpha]
MWERFLKGRMCRRAGVSSIMGSGRGRLCGRSGVDSVGGAALVWKRQVLHTRDWDKAPLPFTTDLREQFD